MQEVKDYTSFGCCSFWRTCQLGQTECVYAKSNPAKQSACGAFRNAQQVKTEQFSIASVNEKSEIPQLLPREELIQEQTVFQNDEEGQFTLF